MSEYPPPTPYLRFRMPDGTDASVPAAWAHPTLLRWMSVHADPDRCWTRTLRTDATTAAVVSIRALLYSIQGTPDRTHHDAAVAVLEKANDGDPDDDDQVDALRREVSKAAAFAWEASFGDAVANGALRWRIATGERADDENPPAAPSWPLIHVDGYGQVFEPSAKFASYLRNNFDAGELPEKWLIEASRLADDRQRDAFEEVPQPGLVWQQWWWPKPRDFRPGLGTHVLPWLRFLAAALWPKVSKRHQRVAGLSLPMFDCLTRGIAPGAEVNREGDVLDHRGLRVARVAVLNEPALEAMRDIVQAWTGSAGLIKVLLNLAWAGHEQILQAEEGEHGDPRCIRQPAMKTWASSMGLKSGELREILDFGKAYSLANEGGEWHGMWTWSSKRAARGRPGETTIILGEPLFEGLQWAGSKTRAAPLFSADAAPPLFGNRQTWGAQRLFFLDFNHGLANRWRTYSGDGFKLPLHWWQVQAERCGLARDMAPKLRDAYLHGTSRGPAVLTHGEGRDRYHLTSTYAPQAEVLRLGAGYSMKGRKGGQRRAATARRVAGKMAPEKK